MIYYTSDLHLGHGNVIKFDKRPFKTIDEMQEKIIENWNSVVTNSDTVYILGDFCWSPKDEDWLIALARLKGNKVLIVGNHDKKKYSKRLKSQFEDIKDFKVIRDDGRRVILCHYPILFYEGDYDKNTYMLYGHLHNTLEEQYMQVFKEHIKRHDMRGISSNRCHVFPCWCGFYSYTPVTLDQIIDIWE